MDSSTSAREKKMVGVFAFPSLLHFRLSGTPVQKNARLTMKLSKMGSIGKIYTRGVTE
jgi:hypothetical protein